MNNSTTSKKQNKIYNPTLEIHANKKGRLCLALSGIDVNEKKIVTYEEEIILGPSDTVIMKLPILEYDVETMLGKEKKKETKEENNSK